MRPRRHVIALAALLGTAACSGEEERHPTPPPAVAAEEVRVVRDLLSRGLGAEALTRARQLQAEHPDAPDAHVLAGDALGTRGDFAGATREYRKAAELSLTEPVALRLAEALKRSNQRPAAAEVLERYLEREPGSVAALTLAGNGFMEAGDWPKAIRMYERVRSRGGEENPVLLNNLAWAYLEEGDYARALPLAEQAWRLDRSNPATADTLGWALFMSGRDAGRGRQLIEQAARAAPEDLQIRAHLDAVRRGRSAG